MKQTLEAYVNPRTGERAVVRMEPAGNPARTLQADVYLAPGGAVVGEHVHPAIEETFTVLRGCLGYSLNGSKHIARAGDTFVIRPGMRHDWWNAATEEALVRVEITPGDRFKEMIVNLFGLAQDGRTNARGMPGILQLALIAREFDDVIRFTRPPRVVQKVLFGLLAPIAHFLGLRGSYPKYFNRGPTGTVEVDAAEGAA